MALGNADFDAILSTTLKNYTPQLEDNIFNARALTNWLLRKARVSKSGGAKIIKPLTYAENSTANSYSMYDNILTTPQEGISAAEYSWKQAAVTIAIAGLEEAMNNGKEQVIDLLKAKTDQASESLSEKFNEMLFGDGTGNSSKDFMGIKGLVTSSGSFGGIDPASNTWWAAQVEATVEVLALSRMSSFWNTCHGGTNDTPDFLITTATLWEKYESLLQPQLRFSDPKTADAGFVNLLYKGAPIVFDIDCTSGYMYFLNSKHLELATHSEKWFTNTGFQKPVGQDARYASIVAYGNLVTGQRRRLGVLTGKTAT